MINHKNHALISHHIIKWPSQTSLHLGYHTRKGHYVKLIAKVVASWLFICGIPIALKYITCFQIYSRCIYKLMYAVFKAC
jgi:hypothetical protein